MARRLLLPLLLVATAGLGVGACSEDLKLEDGDSAQVKRGARLFAERCSGCHTLDAAGTQGSAVKVHSRENTDGPNFNQRPEKYDYVLYAIRNGGISGAIMPQNIVVGEDAEAVSRFLAKYAGKEASDGE